ncbi:hypothetical protein ABI59_08600 [Acidobacteria bacterium Mor1]|nr:hypothetical protein ABI59_08600 [Acidobacteria bacterium Mor1]
MTQQSIAEQVHAAVIGDSEARDWMYREFHSALHRRLAGRYGRWKRLEIDDLVQDLFVLLFQNDAQALRRFVEGVPSKDQTSGRLAGYLWDAACGIMANRRRSYERAPQFEEATPDVATAEDLETRAHGRALIARLETELRRSETRVYLYYRLRCVEGLTPREISHVTGWTREETYALRGKFREFVQACTPSGMKLTRRRQAADGPPAVRR